MVQKEETTGLVQKERVLSMDIQIYEIFKSIQGEGCLQGVPSVLLRLTGCNLNCRWCDTKHFFYPEKVMNISMNSLMDTLDSYECKNIVVTGGEPMINPQICDLVKVLKNRGFHVTIETNATAVKDIDCDLVSMSPKLSHSIPYGVEDEATVQRHANSRINIVAIRHYIKNNDYQIKFVARDRQEDIDEIRSILEQIGEYDPFKVLVMPLADSRSDLYRIQRDLVRLCIDNGLRYANRLQLQIWGNKKEA